MEAVNTEEIEMRLEDALKAELKISRPRIT
jgi:hypothetical protein